MEKYGNSGFPKKILDGKIWQKFFKELFIFRMCLEERKQKSAEKKLSKILDLPRKNIKENLL